MAKREAQARSFEPVEKAPGTLTSQAEEQARALKRQLLETTELAAQQIVGQTRVEGERRIETAGAQARAIAETVTAIEQAEQSLTARARAFAAASKALRAELTAFAETLSEGERKLTAQTPEARDLRLVESPAEPAPRAVPGGVEQIAIAADAEEVEAPAQAEVEDESRSEEELESDDDEEDDPEFEDEDDDEDPPTPAQIA
jgi:hypothetical protein